MALVMFYDTNGQPQPVDVSDGSVHVLLGGVASDGSKELLRFDSASNTLQTIDYVHSVIHTGSHFFATGVATLPTDDVLDFTWVMPNTTKWIHWMWKLDTSSEMAWYIYENAVIVNPLANVMTPYNSDRNSIKVSDTAMRYEIQADLAAANVDTNVTTAILLKSGISGAGKQMGGGDSREYELILKQGATYCLRAVATAGGYIDFDMQWYEHTNL